jgi:hypothetical protein
VSDRTGDELSTVVGLVELGRISMTQGDYRSAFDFGCFALSRCPTCEDAVRLVGKLYSYEIARVCCENTNGGWSSRFQTSLHRLGRHRVVGL